jgi:prepilin-type N-terminal cleavage/methylation domain-containing protein
MSDFHRRRAFSLVELLVAVSIILVLMALMGAAVSAARSSQKKQATQTLIGKLDAIIQQQFDSYASRSIPGATPADRAAELRWQATGDLPDRWLDVKWMAEHTGDFRSPHQRAYIAVWNSLPAPRRDPDSEQFVGRRYSGAECLFMIVMRGGIADCLDCSDLANRKIGDKDGDGAFEFWDEWDNPIGYILWPGGLELPAGSGTPFFSSAPPFAPGATGRTLRPLIYSAGADGLDTEPTPPSNGDFGFQCNPDSGNLAAGANCGVPSELPALKFAIPFRGASDNITNFDAEANQ